MGKQGEFRGIYKDMGRQETQLFCEGVWVS